MDEATLEAALAHLTPLCEISRRGGLVAKSAPTVGMHTSGRLKSWITAQLEASATKGSGSIELMRALLHFQRCGEAEIELFRARLIEALPKGPVQAPFVLPEDFVAGGLERGGFFHTPRGWFRFSGGGVDSATREVMLTELHCQLFHHNSKRAPSAKLPKDSIGSFLDQHLHRVEAAIALVIRKRTAFDPEAQQARVEWLNRLHSTLKIRQDLLVWRTVMTHFIWQVKRRIFKLSESGLITRYPLWVAIHGKQGVGKDYLCENVLFAPIRGRYATADVGMLADLERQAQRLQTNYVINFNELAVASQQQDGSSGRLSRNAISQLKAATTSDMTQIRQFGTQQLNKLVRTAEFFSTANFHLYDVIDDDTGMRRFFEFDSDQPANIHFDANEIRELGELACRAWQGVDEHDPRGYFEPDSEIGRAITAIQESYRPKTTVQTWLEMAAVEVDRSVITPAQTAYAWYAKWCETSGHSPFALTNFLARLAREGLVSSNQKIVFIKRVAA